MLSKFKEKYPAYKDMSDQDLAEALHAKYYKDMDKAEFMAKVMPEVKDIEVEEPAEEAPNLTEVEPEEAETEDTMPEEVDTFKEDVLEILQEKTSAIVAAISNIRPPKIDTTSIANAMNRVAGAIHRPADLTPIENALHEIADVNRMMCEYMKPRKPEPVKPWTFTIKRDTYDRIKSVYAEQEA